MVAYGYSCAMGPKGRPIGIWIIVILEAVNAMFGLADVVAGTNLSGAGVNRLAHGDDVVRAFVIVWGALLLIAVVSLFSLRRRGWALMMLLVGLSLAANLITWWLRPAETQWVSLSLNVVAAFYLNSAAVRGLFLERREVTRISIGGRTAS